MDLYLASAEQQQYLTILLDAGVTKLAISYYEWIRRHDDDRLPKGVDILIHPGVSKKSTIDFDEFAKGFCEFAELHAERAVIYDMDSIECPAKVRRSIRRHLSTLPNVVMFPNEDETLDELAHQFDKVGVNARTSKSMSPAELRRIGADLYGSNVLDLTKLRAGRFIATTTMAWLSPKRFGELWVFSGARLYHYGADSLVKAVRRHHVAIEGLGFDPDKCSANDHDEMVGLAIASMVAAADSLSKRPRDREAAAASAEVQSLEAVDPPDQRGAVLAPNGAQGPPEGRSELLPVIQLKPEAEGHKVLSQTSSARMCDTCNLAGSCPKTSPGSACAFSFPVEIKTRAQWTAVSQVLLETQFDRAMFSHFADQVDGGIPSAKTGSEIDRWFKILTAVKELEHLDPPQPPKGAISAALEGLELPNAEKISEQIGQDRAEEDQEILEADWVADDGFADEQVSAQAEGAPIP